jgi:hypothetical protein
MPDLFKWRRKHPFLAVILPKDVLGATTYINGLNFVEVKLARFFDI